MYVVYVHVYVYRCMCIMRITHLLMKVNMFSSSGTMVNYKLVVLGEGGVGKSGKLCVCV